MNPNEDHLWIPIAKGIELLESFDAAFKNATSPLTVNAGFFRLQGSEATRTLYQAKVS